MNNNQPAYIHTENVHNKNASDVVVPILINLFSPTSVLDVGCGTGTWLHSFKDAGVHHVLGIDGDFVDRTQLAADLRREEFTAHDLTTPFNLQQRFDLVLSLEVAEHLPATSAKSFVASLCIHSDIVVFSAAIPHQGGQNHLNEQWKSYWISFFAENGFQCFDLMRPRIWNNDRVDWWYKQNMLVFSTKDFTGLKAEYPSIVEAIHPELFQHHVDYIIYLQEYCRQLEERIYTK